MLRSITIAALVLLISPAYGADCRKIVRNFHGSWGNLYDYVWSFPKAQQKQVLACLGCPANAVASWPDKCFNHGGQ